MYQVQVRKAHGKWTTRYSLDFASQAVAYYRSLITFGDYRKRIVAPDGTVIARQQW